MSDEVPRELHRSVAKTIIDMVEDSDDPKVYVGAAGKAPYSLGSGLLSDEDDDDVEDEEDEDKEIIEHNNERKRTFVEALKCKEDYEEFFNEPDLAEYFSKFEMSNFQIIAMCRTYANYLAQKERSKLPATLQAIKKMKAKK
ncbi:MAG: hypothetical protein [Cressdnaviricota sp.]|nr:MAG: hypothetical protein [Cressdnaviricota sp.]